jgi:hypothetical protein
MLAALRQWRATRGGRTTLSEDERRRAGPHEPLRQTEQIPGRLARRKSCVYALSDRFAALGRMSLDGRQEPATSAGFMEARSPSHDVSSSRSRVARPDPLRLPPPSHRHFWALRWASRRASLRIVEARRRSLNTCRALCGHRVCTAFIGGPARPEVQLRWRRSRYLPCGSPASVGSGHAHGRVFRSAVRLICVPRRATLRSIGNLHAVNAIASRAG